MEKLANLAEKCSNFDTCHGFIRNQSRRGIKKTLCKVCLLAHRRQQSREAMRRLRAERKLANGLGVEIGTQEGAASHLMEQSGLVPVEKPASNSSETL